MKWGCRVEPINRRTEIHVIGRQLFALQVFINESKSETLVLKWEFWHVDLWIVAVSTLKTPFFFNFALTGLNKHLHSFLMWSDHTVPVLRLYTLTSLLPRLPPRPPADTQVMSGSNRRGPHTICGALAAQFLEGEKWISAVISPTFSASLKVTASSRRTKWIFEDADPILKASAPRLTAVFAARMLLAAADKHS